jgi:hypothetical protein
VVFEHKATITLENCMISYKELICHFGRSLLDVGFRSFIDHTFKDLTEYDITESDYIISQSAGIELGFKNSDTIYDEDDKVVFQPGTPLFSHVNIFPTSALCELPFRVSFSDHRNQVVKKAGQPTQTRQGDASFLGPAFLVDNYSTMDMVISFDFDPQTQRINFIQIRDNNLCTNVKV